MSTILKMPTVTTMEQIVQNINTFEKARYSKDCKITEEWKKLVKRGRNFIVYISSDSSFAFIPSRFVGYANNDIECHLNNKSKAGNETDDAINKILGKCSKFDFLEKEYLHFLEKNNIEVKGYIRSYWITYEVNSFILSKIVDTIRDSIDIDETTKQQLISARIGQGEFRKASIRYWKGKCCITGCDIEPLLKASHIKPWKDSSNEERLDVYNCLLLAPHFDALFDKGFISFEDNGKIKISSKLDQNTQKLFNCYKEITIKLDKKHIKYLEWHRKNVFR